MGCCGEREKGPRDESQKWDFITLSDFRCTSAWTVVAYIWLWFMAFVGVAVYVADTYTAVNLLAFNQWSSEVKPALDIKYSKWIFAICILVSWVLCLYEWFRAIRVIRRRGVAESFLDPLAVNLQSMRPQGWKRFLVFSALTKSKKGADYVALFVYFSFKTAFRVILAEGPRQVVNGMTLYAVLQADLIPGEASQRSSFDQFWFNVEQLADENKYQAVTYFTMLFTLIIWVFSALSLIISAVLYIVFLWHYIPQRDGRLNVYCRRKIDRRLEKIVEHKVKAAIEDEERKKQKAVKKAELKRQKTGELPPPVQSLLKHQPTLPDLGESPDLKKQDRQPDFPLFRQDTSNTVTTLPPYSVRPPTRNENPQKRQPTLPDIMTDARPGTLERADTQASGWSAAPSYSAQAPLLDHAGYAGGADGMPAPPPAALNRQDSYVSFSALPFHGRTASQSTQGSHRAFTPGPRMNTPLSARPYTPTNGPGYGRATPAPQIPLPVRTNTAQSFNQDPQSATSIRSHQDGYGRQYGPPMRSNTADGFRPPPMQQSSGISFSSLHSQQSFSRPGRKPSNGSSNRSYTPATFSGDRRASPIDSYEMTAQPAHTLPAQTLSNGYVAFNPSMHSATTAPTLHEGPRRNITAGPPGTGNDYFGNIHAEVPQRCATAPNEARHSNYAHDILDEYGSSGHEGGIRRPTPPDVGLPRANTAGPPGSQWRAY